MDGGKQGGSIKKVKKDKAGSAMGRSAKPEANIVSAAPRVKPELPLPTVYPLKFTFLFNRLCLFYIGCGLKLKALCYHCFFFPPLFLARIAESKLVAIY